MRRKCIIRWKYSIEFWHVEFEDEYKKYLISRGKIEESGGTIKNLWGKRVERNLLSNMKQLSIVFHILSKCHLMTYYPHYMKYLYFLKVSNIPTSYWPITDGWLWERYLTQVEKDDIK